MKPIVASILASAALSLTLAAVAANAQSTGNAAAGKKIYAANCSACHGATGAEGGVGPSLKNETKKKNLAQIVAWIKSPQPPMPKLYPSPLSATDVNNVAAFVASIK
ncbi:MAG TPA: cytochrome c [Candidatus Binatia bacterium]|nr:cytochrome c [Candidatus Binatia bacterium]